MSLSHGQTHTGINNEQLCVCIIDWYEVEINKQTMIPTRLRGWRYSPYACGNQANWKTHRMIVGPSKLWSQLPWPSQLSKWQHPLFAWMKNPQKTMHPWQCLQRGNYLIIMVDKLSEAYGSEAAVWISMHLKILFCKLFSKVSHHSFTINFMLTQFLPSSPSLIFVLFNNEVCYFSVIITLSRRMSLKFAYDFRKKADKYNLA